MGPKTGKDSGRAETKLFSRRAQVFLSQVVLHPDFSVFVSRRTQLEVQSRILRSGRIAAYPSLSAPKFHRSHKAVVFPTLPSARRARCHRGKRLSLRLPFVAARLEHPANPVPNLSRLALPDVRFIGYGDDGKPKELLFILLVGD